MITDLLDQIDRLDQEATEGPWIVHPNVKYVYTTDAGMVLDRAWADQPDADLHLAALARTALPQLAKALQAVLAKCASMERGVGYRVSGQHDTWDSYHEGMSDMAGYIEETITDALGDDDA